MSPVADFGPLLLETDIDLAIIDHLQTWVPTYLAQMERERGMVNRTLSRPAQKAYLLALEDDEWTGTRPPAVLVTTASMEDATADGENVYYARYLTNVSVIVSGRTETEARIVASMFAGCVRRCLLQQVPDGVGEIRLTGGRVAPIADLSPESRHLATGMSNFAVYADRIVAGATWGPLPGDPVYEPPDPADPDTPYDPPVNVSRVSVEVQGIPTTEQPGG